MAVSELSDRRVAGLLQTRPASKSVDRTAVVGQRGALIVCLIGSTASLRTASNGY
jgi:hypothetical protein